MHRWLTIFLLLCIPLQFSLAAVSAYCGPEIGSASHHGKHHDHRHEAAAAHGDGADPDAVDHGDADSLHCQSGGATAIFGSAHAPAVSASSWNRIGYVMQVLSPPPPSLPERPNWGALA